MNAIAYLNGSEGITTPQETLSKPVTSLIGVTPTAAEVLKKIGITTIQDLATSSIFNLANQLAEAGKPIVHLPQGNGHIPKIPTDLLDDEVLNKPIERLATEPINVLKAIGQEHAKEIAEALGVTTVRELAKWPPYLAARQLFSAAAGGNGSTVIEEDPEAPSDLVPGTGQYPTERVHYNVIVLDRIIRKGSGQLLRPLEESFSPLDVSQQSETGFKYPAVGALLKYSQSWYTQGLTLGHLLHSVALAPGETTRIAIVDWSRQDQANVTEDIGETETLSAYLGRNRSISEVTHAVATEAQQGFSFSTTSTDTWSGGIGSGAAGQMGKYPIFFTAGWSAGGSRGRSTSTSFATSSGRRELNAEMTQNISDTTQQAANSVRNRRASVVREVSQSESETLSTRAVTNFNHMHALTIQYYEVVQIYKTVIEIAEDPIRCFFLPMKPLDFGNPNVVKRYAPVLASAALTPEVYGALLGYKAKPSGVIVRIISRDDRSTSSNSTIPVDNQKWLEDARRDSGLPLADSSPELWQLPAGTRITGWKIKVVASTLIEPLTAITLIRQNSADQVGHPVGREGQFGAGWFFKNREYSGNTGTTSLADFKAIQAKIGVGYDEDPNSRTSYGTVELQLEYFGRAFVYRQHFALPNDGSVYTLFTCEPQTEEINTSLVPQHLQEHALYYSQAIWRSLSGPELVAHLEGYSFQGEPVTDVIDANPIATVGNYLIFRFYREDDRWKQFLQKHKLTPELRKKSRREDIVPLPSGGVFAEAVLGRFNSAEKLDITRFWNWQDSPIPITAPEIAPLQAGSRAQQIDVEPGQLGQPIINLVNAPAMPDPTGMTAAINAISNGAMFRDMSHAAETVAAASGALAAGFAAGGQSQEMAARQAEAAAALAAKGIGGLGGSGTGGKGPTSPGTISNAGARINHGADMDKRGVGQKKGAGGEGSQQDNNAGAGEQNVGEATDKGGTNASYEDQAFQSDIGTDGGNSSNSAVLKLLQELVKSATPSGGTADTPISISYDSTANKDSVSDYTVGVLKDILRAAKLSSAIISSTTRTPSEQARVMYNNIEAHSVDQQKGLYANAGDQVIDVYVKGKADGKSKDEIISSMEAKIIELGPTTVSKHCADTSELNVIDVRPSSIANHTAFEKAVEEDTRVSKFLKPPSDPAYHLEVPQTL